MLVQIIPQIVQPSRDGNNYLPAETQFVTMLKVRDSEKYPHQDLPEVLTV